MDIRRFGWIWRYNFGNAWIGLGNGLERAKEAKKYVFTKCHILWLIVDKDMLVDGILIKDIFMPTSKYHIYIKVNL